MCVLRAGRFLWLCSVSQCVLLVYPWSPFGSESVRGACIAQLLLFYYAVSMISPVLVDTAARRSGLVAARNIYLWYVTALLCSGHSQSKE